MRKTGILLPIFSLPGPYGIGCFSDEAYRFADFLKESGQSVWQILPVGPTGYGDSPYQSFSTFAGNPYFISLPELIRQGLLSQEECAAAELTQESSIDYGAQYKKRFPLLHLAYERSDHKERPDFQAFVRNNAFWLPDYALFMAVKDVHGGAPLDSWEEPLSLHEADAVASWTEKLRGEIGFYEYLQYEFSREWHALKSYVNSLGIRIVGDIPIYVAPDSADFWAHRELFQTDERGRIRQVAGVPPDGFSATGQLWGNPLYDWAVHEDTGYAWWIRRIEKCLELYDIIRIDHFRGFDEYFAVAAGEETAVSGHWEKGPGISLFRALKEKFGELDIIAEDLGYITDSVREMVRWTHFPNMKVLEFAFDSRDSTGANDYLPFNYEKNCVVYTGTHDNETLLGWTRSILPEELAKVKAFLDVRTDDPQEIVEKMIIAAHSSVADLSVIPMQDYLGLDNSARINHPSTLGKNWLWRMSADALTPELASRIRSLTMLYGRL
ncbi:MAG: 4-alpha-glucanotransferase [Lachnospiraceae bacterium]|nr:4-alpha-glucanotransferase [Lachnospiraceae bacterium]